MSLVRNLPNALAWAVSRIGDRWRAILAFALAFRLINFVLLAPLTAATLRLFLSRWGRASVGNFEVAAFLLSPTGLAAIVVVGAVMLGAIYLELAGLMRLLAERRLAWWRGLSGPAGQFPRLVWLGIRQLLVFLILALPFVAAIAAVYAILWRGRDLYGLLALKPPVFWLGAGLAGLLLALYALLAGRLWLHWMYALPILMFEPGVSVNGTLKRSVERTRGQLPTLAAAVVAWVLIEAALTAVVLGGLRLGSEWVLERVGHSLTRAIPVTAALVGLHGLMVALLSIVGTVSFAGLVLALYRQGAPEIEEDREIPQRITPWSRVPVRWLIGGGLVALLGLSVQASLQTLRSLSLADRLQITAHRAGAANGPENTIAALRRAIIDRADWAEIDIQLTSDNALVVFHDTDLARFGGGNRQVGRVRLEEIQQLDVGSGFGPEFAGERVPTFDAFLEAVRGQPIGLTIELKLEGRVDGRPLTTAAVAAIRRAGMLDQCRLCSQSYDSLMLARRLEPKLKVGWIAANALGDVTKLEVDFLMLKTELATRALVERAATRKIAIHAWTVKDPAWIARLLDRGVENVITDDPALMRARLQEIRALSPVDRLLLRVRDALLD